MKKNLANPNNPTAQIAFAYITPTPTLFDIVFSNYSFTADGNPMIIQDLLKAKGYLIEDSKLELNQDLYSKMEKEIYETIIPWIKQNITYRNIKRPQNATDKIYVDIFPNALN